MRFSFLALTPVKLIGPRRKSRALLSKLVKGLADDYGPGKSAVNPNRFATALNDGSDTRIFGCPSRQASGIDQNQTKPGDGWRRI
jgi:hypothetical protein